jgi:NADH dehydrogenase
MTPSAASDSLQRSTDVLVLGGGFAGTRCAQRLERLLPKDTVVTLVSSENYFVFQPLLPEVVGASLSPSHVISPLRHLLRRTQVVRGEVAGIELAAPGSDHAGTVTVTAEGVDERVTYRARHLVLALGSVVDVRRIPGMAEHALLMKNVADALTLRHTIITRLERAVLEPDPAERAAMLTFVVVGGGFSGVETAAEVHDLVRGARRYFPALAGDPHRVVCVHSRDRILPELDERLGAHALRVLQKRGVEFRLSARTRAASREGVYLEGGELIASRTIVCTVGNAPHPALAAMARPEDGRVVTDEFLHVAGRDRVWALGDCAVVADGHGGVSPPTAQFATRQGDVAGANVAAALAGRPLRTFRHKSQGQLATLGHLNAVAALGRLRITGFLAWWLWRTIYLLKLPRFDRKLRVVIDWTLNLFFPRDLNALALQPSQGHAAIHLEAGEVLFQQGDPSATFYVIETGKILLSRCDESGCEVANDTLGAGEHFGEGSLLRRKVRATTAVAVEPTRVLAFPAREFATLTRCFAGLRKLLDATSRRFQPAKAILPAWVTPDRLREPVRTVMTSPVLTMTPTATLQDSIQTLLDRRINAFPLVDDSGHIAGIVTSTDVFAALRSDVDLKQPLHTMATRSVQCVEAEAPIERAVEIMRRRDVKHVVVVDAERRVVGIVSIKDVLRLVLAHAPGAAAATATR